MGHKGKGGGSLSQPLTKWDCVLERKSNISCGTYCKAKHPRFLFSFRLFTVICMFVF